MIISLLRSYPNLQSLNICFKEHSTSTTTVNTRRYQQLQQSSALDTMKRLKKVEIDDFGESKVGSIPAPIKPLQIFVFANVALALKAARDKQEKEMLLLDA
ncbi:hypothetical protein IFM89_016711 [Coptis chinensis]|uniref:Uncharacterized protein n=1 Tax=Coptis chinensis TaxID=261450 RepID=A0A835M9C3_9MAGN|nr:hypothetical protein IFM89_016711 [Coptis chinensis]